MVCIHCSSETRVANSRPQKRLNQVWRRRRCERCAAVFTTEETPDYSAAWAVRSTTGGLQPFSRDKLLLSLYASCQHRKTALQDAGGLTKTVIKKLSGSSGNGTIDRARIGQVVQVALNRFDPVASTHYRAFHQL